MEFCGVTKRKKKKNQLHHEHSNLRVIGIYQNQDYRNFYKSVSSSDWPTESFNHNSTKKKKPVQLNAGFFFLIHRHSASNPQYIFMYPFFCDNGH